MSNTIQLLNIVSRFAFAIAIVYFAYQLSRIVDNLPVIENSLSQVGQQVPPVLEEVKQVRLEVAAIRQQIPEILSVADRAMVTASSAEEKITTLLPQTLNEIRLTREKIDPTLKQVDLLIDKAAIKVEGAIAKAEGAGQEASEGAVTGILSGILKLPFNLIGTLASPILKNVQSEIPGKLTQKDIELMGEAGKLASKSKVLEKQYRWENLDSGNSGSISVLRRFKVNKDNCVEVKIVINGQKKSMLEKVEEFCRGDDNDWKLRKVVNE